MTLSKWIEDYCDENGITLPDGIPDEKTALMFINTVSNGGGGDEYNITYVSGYASIAYAQIPYDDETELMHISLMIPGTYKLAAPESGYGYYMYAEEGVTITGSYEEVTAGDLPYWLITGDVTISEA